MNLFYNWKKVQLICSALFLILCATFIASAQEAGGLTGRVTDELGGVVVGATVTATHNTATSSEQTATTNGEGVYAFTNLPPGNYTVRVESPGFAQFINDVVEIGAGRRVTLDITLAAAVEQEQVTVAGEQPISTDPENNAGAIVLRGEDLEALPEDPEELAAALQALAGPSAGPNGGQIYIDGFTGGRLPPRESIREVRVNQNPFAAEFDRLGFGRIEILTRPGTDRFRGSAFFGFEDESFNSRNPFAPNRAPYQQRRYGGNVSGTIIPRRLSFFFDFDRSDQDDNAVINATILDPNLQAVPFSLAVLTPRRRMSFSPRFDYSINENNTLVGRYSYSRNRVLDQGIGEFSLPSRAFDFETTQHNIQLTETAVISGTIINETRFQYIRTRSTREGDNSIPTIRVLDAFEGGGSQIGFGFSNEDRIELQNYTTFTIGSHTMKAGGRLRSVWFDDSSPSNFGGTFTFTSLDQYRNTILNVPGARPSQFTIAGGNPEANVSQTDFGAYFQDDWRVRPNFTLSLGLRYETQTNINSNFNFAPRISFAYSFGGGGNAPPPSGIPGMGGGGGRPGLTVIRGGFGVFYDRFGENFTLQANRFNGTNQQQFIVTGATPEGIAILDQINFAADGTVSNLPLISSLTAQPQITRLVADDLSAPYTLQSAISIERQLPYNITVAAIYINALGRNLLRSRNINAPLPDTFNPFVPGSGDRPLGDEAGNIYQFESTGRSNQNQFIVNVRTNISRAFSLFGNYVLNRSNSDTDGAGSFPVNQYDLSNEYGRTGGFFGDIRHRVFLGGFVRLPFGFTINPLISATSGRPFNITTGRDNNGDTIFNDRPAFADNQTAPGDLVATRFGNFDINPKPGQTIIPRNFGEGPGSFTVNMFISRTFGFGSLPDTSAGGGRQGGGGRGARGGSGGGGGGARRGGGGPGGPVMGGGGGGPFMIGGGGSDSRYNLTFSVRVFNLLNRTNPGLLVGNLLSPRFGEPTSLGGGFGFGGGGGGSAAGNRRIEGQVRFSF
jgi:hypothetical protein